MRKLAAVLQEIAAGEPTVEERTWANEIQGGTQETMSKTVPQAILDALELIGYFQDPDHARPFELKPSAVGDGTAFMKVSGTARGGTQDGGGLGVLPSLNVMRFGRPPAQPELGPDLGGLT